jgi:hypothetical protein
MNKHNHYFFVPFDHSAVFMETPLLFDLSIWEFLTHDWTIHFYDVVMTCRGDKTHLGDHATQINVTPIPFRQWATTDR